MKKIIFFVLFFLTKIYAETFYIAKWGNDTNSGSSSSPFFTIQTALNKSSTECTLFITPGIYTQFVMITNKNSVIITAWTQNKIFTLSGKENLFGISAKNLSNFVMCYANIKNFTNAVCISNCQNIQIYSNILSTNYNSAFYIKDSRAKIYRNLIKNNRNYGFYFEKSASLIVNNTIFKSENRAGIFLTNNSQCTILNNIVYSCKTGIKNSDNGTAFAAYNCFYENQFITNGNIILGNGNIFENPLINLTSFTITKVISPVVDTGTNIAGITKTSNIDLGWKEFPFDLTKITFQPKIVSVKAINCCEIHITWTNITQASSYTLFRSLINDTNQAVSVGGVKYDTVFYIDRNNILPETKYFYWLKAYNRLGCSPFSVAQSNITTSLYYPKTFKVFPTYFNPKKDGLAKIFFSEEKPEIYWIKIYDISGKIVKQWNEKIFDRKFVEWDGRDNQGNELPVGLYVVHIKALDKIYNIEFEEKIKMVIIK